MPKLHHNLDRYTGRRKPRTIRAATLDLEMAMKPILNYNPTGSASYIQRGAAEQDAHYLSQFRGARVVRCGNPDAGIGAVEFLPGHALSANNPWDCCSAAFRFAQA